MKLLRRVGMVLTMVFILFPLFVGLSDFDRVQEFLNALQGVTPARPLPPVADTEVQRVVEQVLNTVSEADVRRHMARFTQNGSRVCGYPGHEAAARFIRDEFERIGLRNVALEPFDVTSPVDKGCRLTLLRSGASFPIYAVWPNLAKTSTLPRSGVRTRLIYGGDGEFRDFEGHDIENAAVLMEFNSGNNWLKAAMLGVSQVIFIEPDATFTRQAEQKFLQVPNGVERFWIDRESGRALERTLAVEGELEVELRARMDWEKKTAYNILGSAPGTDPELKDQIVVINAYYDAMSVVPALAPGAEMACGIVALMELVDYFKRYPPGRTVLFLASSAHHLGFRGICDFLRRHARKEEHFAALMTDPIDVRLFIGLDLTSQTDEIGIWHNSRSLLHSRFFSSFGKKFVRIFEMFAGILGPDSAGTMVNGITPAKGMTWDMYIPGKNLKTDGEVVFEAGLPAISLVTVNDARFRVDTPLDLPERVNYENLTGQIRILAGVLALALDDSDLIPDFRQIKFDDRMRGLKGFVRTFPRRSIVPDRPKPGAVAALRMGVDKSVKGVRRIYYDIADEKGEFYMPGIAERRVAVSAYYLDVQTGEVSYAPNFGQQARIYASEFDMDWWISKRTLILFPCIATDFYDTVDPRYLTKLSQISIYGEGHTAPQEYGYAIGFGPTEPVGTIFTHPGEKVKIVMRSGAIGVRFLLLNSLGVESKEAARGAGFQTLTQGAFVRTSFQAAKDMWMLNEARIRELERYAIENQRLNVLHADAAVHIQRAEEAMAEKRWDAFMMHTRAALGIESRAYPDVKSTQNDVVRGIIFFMALVIPCAFFAERLIFSAADIRWQIAGFAGIFAVIWFFLSTVHPAFELSNPIVILLAFVILALAVFVIWLVFSRFNENMRRLRVSGTLLHETDVGRISASLAAFYLGIANMKRRKLRTWLTFITLALLTFTVLSFTSIKSILRFYRLPREATDAYPGILIRSKFWGALEESAYDYAKVNFESIGAVVPRSWYFTRDKKKIPVASDQATTRALGVLGVTPQEPRVTGLDRCLKVGRWFRPGELACILSEEMAGRLGVMPGDLDRKRVRIFGEQLTVVGVIDSEKFKEIKDLDGEILSPADFKVTDDDVVNQMVSRVQLEKQGLELPQAAVLPFTHIDPENILIIPYHLLREVGSPLQSVAVRFFPGVNVKAQVEAFLSRLSMVLFAGIPDGEGRIQVSVYSSLGNISFRGLGNLFIPILIAALIVLNTMMGSVYERFKEIGIYSAVGLAPVHVAFLFIAEACVYAVLGTVCGYLLGQGVAKALLAQGWLAGVTLNYSALSTVYAAALVMAVVMLSALFPAQKASLIAGRNVTRRWKLPNPEGNCWRFEFPFTVGSSEALGLFVFLTDYFASHNDESMGVFYTNGAKPGAVQTETGEGYTIDTTVWLAPYDVGVSERIHFEAVPTGEHNIHALLLRIDRISGDNASWRRVNQRFMKTLRKQFLIWRTVDPSTKAAYRERGLKEVFETQEGAV